MSDTELLPKSKPEPVRRLEVFTGTGRRRAWTAEQKAQIVAESYAERRDGVGGCAPARTDAAAIVRLASGSASGGRKGREKRLGICAGDRGSSSVRRGPHRWLRPARGSPMIEIVIGAATVRIPPGIDAATLPTVLRAVKAAT